MGRIENQLTDLPAHMQAVFFRQFAREAESLAHQSPSRESQESYRRLAAQWRGLAEELDAANEKHEFGDASGPSLETTLCF